MHGYMVGGTNLTLLGTVDKANFTLTLGGRYFYIHDPTPAPILYAFTVQPNTTLAPRSRCPWAMAALKSILGDIVNVEIFALLVAAISPANRDSFFVDVSQAYRGPTDIKALDLGYPAATVGERGLYVRRQGSVWYWPFSLTQVLYAPDVGSITRSLTCT